MQRKSRSALIIVVTLIVVITMTAPTAMASEFLGAHVSPNGHVFEFWGYKCPKNETMGVIDAASEQESSEPTYSCLDYKDFVQGPSAAQHDGIEIQVKESVTSFSLPELLMSIRNRHFNYTADGNPKWNECMVDTVVVKAFPPPQSPYE